MVMIVDPPAPPTGTTLIFDQNSQVTMSTLYPVGGTPASPAFEFETVLDNHFRLRAGGAGGAVLGEVFCCGMFEKGVGTVTVKFGGGRQDLEIEDWGTGTDRRIMVPIDEMYVWGEVIQTSPNGNVVTRVLYEAKVDDKVMAIYTPSWMPPRARTSCSSAPPAPGSGGPLTRAHIHFTPEVDEKVYAQLLLSLSIFKVTVLENTKRSTGDFMTAASRPPAAPSPLTSEPTPRPKVPRTFRPRLQL